MTQEHLTVDPDLKKKLDILQLELDLKSQKNTLNFLYKFYIDNMDEENTKEILEKVK